MYFNNETLLFLKGKLVKATEANTNLYSQTLHYGYGAFEGVRSYKTETGAQKEHYKRLLKSCELVQILLDYSVDELLDLTYELLERNKLQDAYEVPLVYWGDNMGSTVTGKAIAENLKDVPGLKTGQDIFLPLENPIKDTSHLQTLYKNLASKGSVATISGKEGGFFEGPAKVFDDEQLTNHAIEIGKVKKGDVIVIRYCGPKGGPGMPEMLKPTSEIMGAGLGQEVALITDGKFSGGTHGFVVGAYFARSTSGWQYRFGAKWRHPYHRYRKQPYSTEGKL